mmetsp:Transcript_13692/g.32542  ORF Transcript_13692/g.32542 Transcript_13692/m.32542 type:complete len:230 (-) Transcript_13692:462-1151(-)
MRAASTTFRSAFSMHAFSAGVRSQRRRMAFWTKRRRSFWARLQSLASYAMSASRSSVSSMTRVRTDLMQQSIGELSRSSTVVRTMLIITLLSSPFMYACTITTMPSSGTSDTTSCATCSEWRASEVGAPIKYGASPSANWRSLRRPAGSGAGSGAGSWGTGAGSWGATGCWGTKFALFRRSPMAISAGTFSRSSWRPLPGHGTKVSLTMHRISVPLTTISSSAPLPKGM